MLPLEYWITVAVTIVAIVACVSLHYEGLRLVARIPIGPIRFVTGTQSIAGLTLITWSASCTFIEMTQAGSVRNDR